jgi:predicted transcriptional regulator
MNGIDRCYMGRTKQMSDEQIIELIRDHPDRAVTAGDIASDAEMTTTGLLNRLNELASSGAVHKKRAGANAVVWWVD